jgi:hypothetical protein
MQFSHSVDKEFHFGELLQPHLAPSVESQMASNSKFPQAVS